jgi:alpha-glucosidase (family GH31 glycosyl hydrolase)
MHSLRFAPCLFSLALSACGGDDASEGAGSGAAPDPCRDMGPEEALTAPPIHTPRWAFEPWISKDISDAADTRSFVQGFRDRDIPVGAVVLDSPWETHYNTFVPNPSRYPELGAMVSELHAEDVRVVLWMTQFVNNVSFDFEIGGDAYVGPSPSFEEGQGCGFFVDEGAPYGWWKGSGAAIDFFDPYAMRWWHAQQHAALDLGIDGWKLDFGDSYVRSDPVATDAGPVPHQQYSEKYYEDFLAYGAKVRGDEFVTMVRAYDESYEFEGRFHARKEHAPVVWMGDNRRDWVGLADALDHTFRSANAGYVMLGSDIGGYLDHDDKGLLGPEIPFDPVNFARWTAVGALSPFMQLHGRANLEPWTVEQEGEEIVDLYRLYATLHHELVPFFYSLAEEAYAGGEVIVRPVGGEADWPGDYRYHLGEALLVAPVLDATGQRDVELPAGARYYDFWDPTADPSDGGQTIAYDASDLAKIPLFVREGAIVPLEGGRVGAGLDDTSAEGALTVLVYPGLESTFTLHEEDGTTTTIATEVMGSSVAIGLTKAARKTWLRVRGDLPAAEVRLGGQVLEERADVAAIEAAGSGWTWDASLRSAWILVPATAGPVEVDVGG